MRKLLKLLFVLFLQNAPYTLAMSDQLPWVKRCIPRMSVDVVQSRIFNR